MDLRARGGRTGCVGVFWGCCRTIHLQHQQPPPPPPPQHLHLPRPTERIIRTHARARRVCGGLETSRVESNSCTLRCIRGHAAANGRAAVTRTARRVAAAAAARHAPSMDTSGGGTGRGAHKKTRSLCRRVFAAAMGVNARKFCGGPASCVAAIN